MAPISLSVLGFAFITAVNGLSLAQPRQGCEGGFGRADADNDGKVTLDEALAHGKAMFQLNDQNKDGVVTRDETQGRGFCFALADVNHDGQVTFIEHEAFLRARFATMDKNKDGILIGNELNRGRQGGGRGRGGRSCR